MSKLQGLMKSRRWKDLSPVQRAAVLVGSSIQVALAVSAWTDLAFRPAEKVRGGKLKWVPIIAINFVGPVIYFLRGIKR